MNLGFTHSALGYSMLYSNKGYGNPWTFSHVRGRLGIPTTFLFWFSPQRKKDAAQRVSLILWFYIPSSHGKICDHLGLCQRRHEQRKSTKANCHRTQLACLALIKRGNENKQKGVEVYQGFPKWCTDSWIHPNCAFIQWKLRQRQVHERISEMTEFIFYAHYQ